MTDAAAIAAALASVQARVAAAARAVGRDPATVQLVAVSKNHSAAAVRAAFAAGQRDFGENRVQELAAKAASLGDLDGLRWHMIGSLQTNKVRELLRVPGLVLLHSLDRARLATALQQELAAQGRTLAALVQVHATGEATKHGCAIEDAPALLRHVAATADRVRIEGLMAMGPLEGDARQVFERVRRLRNELSAASGLSLAALSMGMSSDLEFGIACGSTIVRVGTDVFGARA